MAGSHRKEYLEALTAGHTLALAGSWEAAAGHYRRAADVEPADPSARAFLAMALARQGAPGDALLALNEAVGLPQSPLVAIAKADLAVQAGRPADACEAFMAAGEMLWQRGRQREAMGAWRKAATQADAGVAAHERLARAYEAIGDAEAAAAERAFLGPFEAAAPVELPTAILPPVPAEPEVVAEPPIQLEPVDSVAVEAENVPAPAEPAEVALTAEAAAVEVPTAPTTYDEQVPETPPVAAVEHTPPEAPSAAIAETAVEERAEPEVGPAPVQAEVGEVAGAVAPEEPELAAATVEPAADADAATAVAEAEQPPAAEVTPSVLETNPAPAEEATPVVPEEILVPAETASEEVAAVQEQVPVDVADALPNRPEDDGIVEEAPAAEEEPVLVEPRDEERAVLEAPPAEPEAEVAVEVLPVEPVEPIEAEVVTTPAAASVEPEVEPAMATPEPATPEPAPPPAKHSWWGQRLFGRRGESAPAPRVEEPAPAVPAPPAIEEPAALIAETVAPAPPVELPAAEIPAPGEEVAAEVETPIEVADEAVAISHVDEAVEVPVAGPTLPPVVEAEPEPLVAEAEVPPAEPVERSWLVPWLEADELVREGKVEAALEQQAVGLRDAIEAGHGDEAALLALARDLPGFDACAVDALATLPAGEREAAILALARASLFDEAGLVVAAGQEYENMIDASPESLVPHIALAGHLARAGRPEQAKAKYLVTAAVCELRGHEALADQLRALARAA